MSTHWTDRKRGALCLLFSPLFFSHSSSHFSLHLLFLLFPLLLLFSPLFPFFFSPLLFFSFSRPLLILLLLPSWSLSAPVLASISLSSSRLSPSSPPLLVLPPPSYFIRPLPPCLSNFPATVFSSFSLWSREYSNLPAA